MTKSQNTKNEQHCIKQNEKSFIQKDLSLTELWQKGELPGGWYWVEGCRDKEIYAYTSEYLNHMYRPKNSDRIIEQVPSYEEYQKLLSDQLAKIEGEEIVAELEARLKKTQELELELRKENTQLKS